MKKKELKQTIYELRYEIDVLNNDKYKYINQKLAYEKMVDMQRDLITELQQKIKELSNDKQRSI